MKPLLAHVYEPRRVRYPCYVQPKLNGIRALYQAGRFQSRDELPFPEGLLDHLAQPLLWVFGPEVILDGELYHHGWPLQRINAAVTPVRQKPTADTLKVEYHVFDVVDFGKSFKDRRQMLIKDNVLTTNPPAEDCGNSSPIFRVYTQRIESEIEANIFYSRAINKGYEGMMYRLGDCPYTRPKDRECNGLYVPPTRTPFFSDKDNRCWHLLKRKDWQDGDFVIVGRTEGEGKQRGMLGAFVCVIQGGKRFTVGSGITDAERKHYYDMDIEDFPKYLKVKYLVLSSDGIPLNPTILAVL